MDEMLPRVADESRVNSASLSARFWQRAARAVLTQRKRQRLIIQENINAKGTTSILTGSNDAHPVSRLARKVMLTLPDDSKPKPSTAKSKKSAQPAQVSDFIRHGLLFVYFRLIDHLCYVRPNFALIARFILAVGCLQGNCSLQGREAHST